jgi:NifB/MoaA-like Fe-S oxidoreductase
MRSFLDDVSKVRRKRYRVLDVEKRPKITLVTGSLAAPALRQLADALNARGLAQARVQEVVNTFWGGNVACAGLLMGEEVLDQLRGQDCGDMIFLPPDAVDNKGRMLDDIKVSDMSAQLDTPIRHDAHGPLDLADLLARI